MHFPALAHRPRSQSLTCLSGAGEGVASSRAILPAKAGYRQRAQLLTETCGKDKARDAGTIKPDVTRRRSLDSARIPHPNRRVHPIFRTFANDDLMQVSKRSVCRGLFLEAFQVSRRVALHLLHLMLNHLRVCCCRISAVIRTRPANLPADRSPQSCNRTQYSSTQAGYAR